MIFQTLQKPKEDTGEGDMETVFREELKRRLMELHKSMEDARNLLEEKCNVQTPSADSTDANNFIKTDKKND